MYISLSLNYIIYVTNHVTYVYLIWYKDGHVYMDNVRLIMSFMYTF